MNVLEQFEQLGYRASFHFADDSGRGWDMGYARQREAEALFIQHPELREEMTAISKRFLWTLKVDSLVK